MSILWLKPERRQPGGRSNTGVADPTSESTNLDETFLNFIHLSGQSFKHARNSSKDLRGPALW